MSYPFPQIEQKIFKKTFLKDVWLNFNFNNFTKGDLTRLHSFFSDNFKLSGIKNEELETGVSVESDNKLVKFIFSPGDVKLKLIFPAYTNFSDIVRWLPTIVCYLKILNVDLIDSLSLRKYYQLNFTSSSESAGVANVMKEIFSRQLLEAKCDTNEAYMTFDDEAATFKGLGKWERNLFFEEDNSRFKIEFGFSTYERNQEKGILTLKNIIETRNCNMSLEQLPHKLDELNLLLDQGFRWCVTDAIINQMEQSDETGI